jgi:hypothetical protein
LPSRTPASGLATHVQRSFAFLTDAWGFRACVATRRSRDDPRDAETLVRYCRGDYVVDVVVTDIALGIFVFVGRLPTPASIQDCETAVPVTVRNFEQFLLSELGPKLTPPLPSMRPYKTFCEMYNKSPRRYLQIVSNQFPQAVQVLADRFKLHGGSLVGR